MKVSVYIEQALFHQALKAAKASILTPSQQIAHWAELGRVMETKTHCSLRLLQSTQKKG
ncbi:TA system antitoxin ParD family protein [Vibrio celticus]|uniref:TA system antitoxin ParD family protein n=1 Tax=Vibrio celticus TaxID=446372 RepID=UPI0040695A71